MILSLHAFKHEDGFVFVNHIGNVPEIDGGNKRL
jgi:hypothetical protein